MVMARKTRLLVLVLPRMGHCVRLIARNNRVVTGASDPEPHVKHIPNVSTVS